MALAVCTSLSDKLGLVHTTSVIWLAMSWSMNAETKVTEADGYAADHFQRVQLVIDGSLRSLRAFHSTDAIDSCRACRCRSIGRSCSRQAMTVRCQVLRLGSSF